jgi:NAD(P)-dependent dehydrogenase (short-subunit alcohol dehydrogenase family)
MKDLNGKTAFVTGAAGAIGSGMARALAREGANLALADMETAPLEALRQELAAAGTNAHALQLDVSDRPAVYRAAEEIERIFGKVHIVCNNAGVGYRGVPVQDIPDSDFDWVFAVNTFGVINGIKAFLPKLLKHGEGGHIVNTASIAGFQTQIAWHHGLYAASKMAVVALSEDLEASLRPKGIGVSVLAPAAVDSKIYRSGRVRPARFGGPFAREPDAEAEAALRAGLSGDQIGVFVLRAIKDGEFFIFTHPQARDYIERRHRRIMAGYDRADRLVAELGLQTRPT